MRIFQSTLPVRGATRPKIILSRLLTFQSTLPVRGATIPGGNQHIDHKISIHAPREGSDQQQQQIFEDYIKFQSTLPVRGATIHVKRDELANVISIHAPREGSDSKCIQFYGSIMYKFHETTALVQVFATELVQREPAMPLKPPWKSVRTARKLSVHFHFAFLFAV